VAQDGADDLTELWELIGDTEGLVLHAEVNLIEESEMLL